MRNFILCWSVFPLFGFLILILAFKNHGKSPEYYYQEGEKQYQEKNYTKAIGYYTRAIRIDSAYILPYYKRGLCYLQLDSNKISIKDFDKAIKLSINPSSDFFYYRATAKDKIKDKIGACTDWNQACELMNNRACDLRAINCR